MHWFIDPIKNQYADFEGRTTRKEYWMFVLISLLLSIGIGIVEGVIGTMFIGFLFSISIVVPSVAIAARRLHDINKSGWWQLIGLIPIVGWIILIVLLASKAKDENNSYSTCVEDLSLDNQPTANPVATQDLITEQAAQPSERIEENTQENKQEGYRG